MLASYSLNSTYLGLTPLSDSPSFARPGRRPHRLPRLGVELTVECTARRAARHNRAASTSPRRRRRAALPVRQLNLRVSSREVNINTNSLTSQQNDQLVRRFFTVDPASGLEQNEALPTVLRYLRSVSSSSPPSSARAPRRSMTFHPRRAGSLRKSDLAPRPQLEASRPPPPLPSTASSSWADQHLPSDPWAHATTGARARGRHRRRGADGLDSALASGYARPSSPSTMGLTRPFTSHVLDLHCAWVLGWFFQLYLWMRRNRQNHRRRLRQGRLAALPRLAEHSG